MGTSAAFRLRQLAYDLESGLLARPAAWSAALVTLAILLPRAEVRLAPGLSATLATEPGAAQLVLGTVAGSVMTVVSVVYSIMLVALSLASTQFSTRILAALTRDHVAPHTLGLFVGTSCTRCSSCARCARTRRSCPAWPRPPPSGW
jgi:uncharacterized membrane protein